MIVEKIIIGIIIKKCLGCILNLVIIKKINIVK